MMPRLPSKETQIKNLTKELNLANGRILDDRARIENLEKRLASKTEYAETLIGQLQKADAELDKNKRLHEMVDALETRLTEESDIKVGLIRTIRDREQKNTIIQGQFDQMKAIAQKMDDQRIALKAALKAVL
jgi:chromosome segregation ATPase